MEPSLPPDRTARVAGALYLAVVVLSVFALGTVGGIVEGDDPAATSRNLAEAAGGYRLAVVANLVATLCYIGVVGLLNELLRPVQPGISRLALLFGLGGCVVGAVSAALQLAGAAMLTGPAAAAGAPAAHSLLVAGILANGVALTLFGCYCLLLGWLVYRSGFIPRLFGALLMLSGAAWLAGNLVILAEPALGGRFLVIVGVAALGEILFTLWLLFKGVDEARWNAPAGRAGGGEAAV
ncbi:DUF4386 domain-containing protein [Allosphingosinicella sp.]|jgi:hypothetical protein|uniref:DUF4386 domain-containing protein n=1 Tax=Allosphingosinicella sp. TaxID=2823234 RepID=UPI002EEB5062